MFQFGPEDVCTYIPVLTSFVVVYQFIPMATNYISGAADYL